MKLTKSGPVYITAMRREDGKPGSAIITNDVCSVTKNPSKIEIGIA